MQPKRYTIVVKVLTSLQALAAEVLELMGEGARIEDCGELSWFKRNNTRIEGGFCRIVVDEHIAVALDYIKDQHTSPNCDLLRIEWHGQDYLMDEDTGELVYSPITWEETYTDEDDVEKTRTRQLGRINV